MKKAIHFIILFLVFSVLGLYSQTNYSIPNKEWKENRGTQNFFYRNVTKVDDYYNVYVAGATLNSSGNYDILVVKYDSQGNELWTYQFDGDAEQDDMATDIFIDENQNVYITGSSVENVARGNDLIVIALDENGDEHWLKYFDGGGTLINHDAGASIVATQQAVYVCGGAGNAMNLIDFVTLKLDISDGTIIWYEFFDENELYDAAAKIEVIEDIFTIYDQVIVTGAFPQGAHYTLDGSRLKSGMYLMQLSNNEKVFTRKIIIQ